MSSVGCFVPDAADVGTEEIGAGATVVDGATGGRSVVTGAVEGTDGGADTGSTDFAPQAERPTTTMRSAAAEADRREVRGAGRRAVIVSMDHDGASAERENRVEVVRKP